MQPDYMQDFIILQKPYVFSEHWEMSMWQTANLNASKDTYALGRITVFFYYLFFLLPISTISQGNIISHSSFRHKQPLLSFCGLVNHNLQERHEERGQHPSHFIGQIAGQLPLNKSDHRLYQLVWVIFRRLFRLRHGGVDSFVVCGNDSSSSSNTGWRWGSRLRGQVRKKNRWRTNVSGRHGRQSIWEWISGYVWVKSFHLLLRILDHLA